MKILLITTLFALFIFTSLCFSEEKQIVDGDYMGLEKMANLSPYNKDAQWFHENTLTIKGNKVTLEKVPIIIKKGKKEYSASDGGFYTFEGNINLSKGKQILILKLINSDYAPVRVSGNNDSPAQLKIDIKKDGSLFIEGVLYKKKSITR
jgi:hypothetical protein